MYSQGCNEEVLALAMQAVRYPGRGEIRCVVSVGEELFVDESIAEYTAMRIDIPREFRNLLSCDRNTLVRIPNFRCQRIQHRCCLRKGSLGGLQCVSSL
jgi:hypothetical protein